ncbi:MAG: arginine repressor [Oscillospiraceae bacterium]|nr:arginine repressor [Oscillospiraceae bacterium]
MKNARQKEILDLIRTNSVGNQDALIELLSARGFPVTQATVSRDIRELNLIKKVDAQGVYRYVLPDAPAAQGDLFAGNIVDVDSAGHTVVIKCRSGPAQAVCTVLDSTPRPEVVGTLAGDDTIFVLVRTGEQAKRLQAELHQKMQDR